MEGEVNRTGFDLPFDTWQVASWVLILIDVLMTYLALIPSIPYPAWVRLKKAVFCSFYSVSLLLTLILAYSVTASNPTDSVISEYSAAMISK